MKLAEMHEIEELSRKITQALDEIEGSSASADEVRARQKRSIMILQQFYKLLLSDFSPTEWKESKAFLRAYGFPTLRDTLKIKPSKLPEKLTKPLERYDGQEERKRQLNATLARLEDAVSDLDDAIFASAKLSKKAEKALERLEGIEDSLEIALSLFRKIDALKKLAETLTGWLPAPEGGLDMEKEATLRHGHNVEARKRELEEKRKELSEHEKELNVAMDRFKRFLTGSGRHLPNLVTLLPLIREITSPYVKFDSDELTDWEVSVAIRNLGKYLSKLPEGHALLRSDESEIIEALEHLVGNREAISDYNRIRHLQKAVEDIREEAGRKEEELRRTEGPAELDAVRIEVKKKADESRREYERLRAQIAESEKDLGEVFEELGAGRDGKAFPALKSEVDELMVLLH